VKLDDVLISIAGSAKVLDAAKASRAWFEAHPGGWKDGLPPMPPLTNGELIDYVRVEKAMAQAKKLLGHLRYDSAVPDNLARRIRNMGGYALDDVFHDRAALLKQGIYEKALLAAFADCALNNARYPVADLALMFKIADRQRLRAAGDPLPGRGPFTLYRGVAGDGRGRRVRGYSWTASFKKAKWFAERLPRRADPAVYEVEAPERWVLVYTNERKEQEFLLRLPRGAELTQVWPARKPTRR
jgi:hypothetical protein